MKLKDNVIRYQFLRNHPYCRWLKRNEIPFECEIPNSYQIVVKTFSKIDDTISSIVKFKIDTDVFGGGLSLHFAISISTSDVEDEEMTTLNFMYLDEWGYDND